MEHLDKSLMGVERLGENQELQNSLLKDSIYNWYLPFLTVLFYPS